MKKIFVSALSIVLFFTLAACNGENDTKNFEITDFGSEIMSGETGDSIPILIEFNTLEGADIEEVTIVRGQEYSLTSNNFTIDGNTIIINDYFSLGSSGTEFQLKNITLRYQGETITLEGNENFDRFSVSVDSNDRDDVDAHDINLSFNYDEPEGGFTGNDILNYQVEASNIPEGYEITRIIVNGTPVTWSGDEGGKIHNGSLNLPQQSEYSIRTEEINLTNFETGNVETIEFSSEPITTISINATPISLLSRGIVRADESSGYTQLSGRDEHAINYDGYVTMSVRVANIDGLDIKTIYLLDENNPDVYYTSSDIEVDESKTEIKFEVRFDETGFYSLSFSHLSYEYDGEEFTMSETNNPRFHDITVIDSIIETREEFMSIQDNPYGTYLLDSDLDFSETETIPYIPYFNGKLLGNGKQITNAVGDSIATSNALFEHLGENARVENLRYNFGNFAYGGTDPRAAFVVDNEGIIDGITFEGFIFQAANESSSPIALFAYTNSGEIRNVNIDPEGRLTYETRRKNASILAHENTGVIEKISLSFNSFKFIDSPSGDFVPSLNYTVYENKGNLKDILVNPLLTQARAIGESIYLEGEELKLVFHAIGPIKGSGNSQNIQFDVSENIEKFVESNSNFVLTPDEAYEIIVEGMLEDINSDLYQKYEGYSEAFEKYTFDDESEDWISDLRSYITGEENHRFINIIDLLFISYDLENFEQRNDFQDSPINFYSNLNFSNSIWDTQSFIPRLRH